MLIDAVISWVDGDDPAHEEKRKKHIKAEGSQVSDLNEPMRWKSSSEIEICLNSLELYAPWINKIFIVSDSQIPKMDNIKKSTRSKIAIVDHTEIFSGYENFLPIFNSLSIESMLFRINDLSENFIYLNDDMFLAGPVSPSDFFNSDGSPVLRGIVCPRDEYNSENFIIPHRQFQLNAAKILTSDPEEVFFYAHVANSFQKSILNDLFLTHKGRFEKNISFKFRNISQFNIAALYGNYILNKLHISPLERVDYRQVSVALIRSRNYYKIKRRLAKIILNRSIKLGCINDYSKLSEDMPELDKYMKWFFSSSRTKSNIALLAFLRMRIFGI